eukprot:XP_008181594.1 PREDICTED: uncharacterized protein LOC100572009 [Acyrthosiphon pisum]
MNSDSEEMRYYVRYNELYDIIHEAHIATGHGGRNRIVYAVNMKIVHGKARHSQSQGSVERANQDIESMIATWMETNKTTKWSESLRFVQAMKNGAFHSGIKRSPYEAMFGIKMKMGLANSIIPKNVFPGLQTEEDLEALLTEPIFENEEVEINKDYETLANENLEIRDEMSNKQMPTVLIGKTVKVKIPEVERSKVDARTLLAVVLKVVDGEFYRLGTKAGTLSQLFTRNQFTLCEENFLKSAIIPENEIGIRQAVLCVILEQIAQLVKSLSKHSSIFISSCSAITLLVVMLCC